VRRLACLAICWLGCASDDACARWASALCARLQACDAGALTSIWGDVTVCSERNAAQCARERNAPSSGASAGALDRCTTALPAQGCGELSQGACAPPSGKLAVGASCAYDTQCQSAHCTVASRWPCGICVPAPAVGDSCDIDCSGALYCDPTTLSCVATPPSPSPEAQSSGPRAPDGMPCDLVQGPGCVPPSRCLNAGETSSGICTPPDAGLCDKTAVRNAGPPTGPFMTAPHDSQFSVPNQGGPLLTAPELITITYADYPYRADVEAYGDWIVGSDFLAGVGGEYGIQLGTNSNVELPGAAPSALSDTGIQQLIAGWQSDGTVPTPGPNTLYMLYLRDAQTHVTGAYGIQSCVEYYGYHSEAQIGAAHFAYALIATCAPIGAYGELPQTEQTASHELIEAATDPFFYSAPAYLLDGVFTFAGELGDLCEGRNDAEGKFAYQRIWSNRAAAAGGDPCAPPNPNDPYFRVEVTPTQVTQLVIGDETELTFTAWSTAPVGELGVWIYSLGGEFAPDVLDPWTGVGQSFFAGMTLPDAPVLENGQSGHIKLLVPPTARPGQKASLMVYANRTLDVFTAWPFVVEAVAKPTR
jgi:hypothetical protein